MFHNLTAEQQELALAMGEISEASYSAGWMIGLEFALWHLLTTESPHVGRYRLDAKTRQRLRDLSERCGGWIVFDDRDGETFVPLGNWLVQFTDDAGKSLPSGG